MARIIVGTSGYSYDDWHGPFYPPQLPKGERLAYYAREFRACEINFTYYRPPTAQIMEGMLQKSGGTVEFVVKAPRALTHDRRGDLPGAACQLVTALSPLVEARALGGVLLQFPYSFHATPQNRDYLKRLRELLPDLPLIVEVRNARWVSQETFEALRGGGMGFCNVDEPPLPGLLPPTGVVTAEPGYLRLHGRNAAKWWDHAEAHERYDYRYSEAELREWLPRLHAMMRRAEKTFVFFNNHFESKAVENAQAMGRLLAERLTG